MGARHRSLRRLPDDRVDLGGLLFISLGRNEDPSFVIKTMVVQAAWPGATIDETLNQVTERLERTLQETPNLDFLRSFTRPGLTTIFVNLKGKPRPAKCRTSGTTSARASATCGTPCRPA